MVNVCPFYLNQVTSDLDEKDLVKLMSNTQILTSKPEQLTTSNISSATEIVNSILSRNMTKVLQEAVRPSAGE